MIPVEIYTAVYYFFLALCIVLAVLPLFFKGSLEEFPKINLYTGTFLILVVTIAFIGLRDPYGNWRYFGDTAHYSLIYDDLDYATYGTKKDIGFYTLMVLCKSIMDVSSFYFICAVIYVLPVFLTFKKWFKEYAFFALIMFVTSMSFWSFGINGIRNGLATSIFIFALGYYNRLIISVPIMLLSMTFHSSLILPFVAFLTSSKVKDTMLLIKVWIGAVVLSFFIGGQIENLIGDFLTTSRFTDDRRLDTYFQEELDGQLIEKRFRLDFVIYSGIAILLGYYYKFKLKFKSAIYDRVFNMYLMANIVWVFLIYLAYTNRIAYLSWFLMPIVMIFPLLKKEDLVRNQMKWIYLMIFGSLLFTLLMEFK